MKLRYYLRGLGIGIAVTALFFVVYTGRTDRGMSDEEVKRRAAELGMIENTVLKPTTGEEGTGEPQQDTTQAESSAEDGTPEGTGTDVTDTDSTDSDLQNTDSTDSDVQDVQDSNPQESESEPEPPEGEYVQITINRGDSSLTAAKKLVEVGVIEDAKDFDRYLSQNGYDKYIRTGVHEVPMYGTYEQIAKALTAK